MYSYAYNSSKAAKYYVEEVNKAKDDAIKPPTRYFLSLRSCRGTFGRELDAKHVFDTKGRAKERKSEEREREMENHDAANSQRKEWSRA